MTIAELKQKLDEMGVEYKKDALKADLEALYEEYSASEPDPEDVSEEEFVAEEEESEPEEVQEELQYPSEGYDMPSSVIELNGRFYTKRVESDGSTYLDPYKA